MTAEATQRAFFSILLLIVTLAFFWVIGGFIQPIFWATVLGIVFFPAYNAIKGRLGGRETVASGVTLIVVLLVAIIPVMWIVSVVASQAAGLYVNIRSGEIDVGAVFDWFNAKLPVVVSWLESMGIDAEKLPAVASSFGLRVSQFLANTLVGFGQNIVRFSLMFTLMLYILFFVFRDGQRILDAAILAVPLDEDKKQELLMRFAEVSRATIKGTAIIGVVQGGIGGIAFAALGIPSAALWGVLMVLMSVVPAVGPALVWMPATLYFFAVGQYVQGAILLIVGGVFISLADNVLRPILVGRDTRMPDYLVLVSTLGGLLLFGLAGVVIGPMIAALFISVWGMAAKEYGE